MPRPLAERAALALALSLAAAAATLPVATPAAAQAAAQNNGVPLMKPALPPTGAAATGFKTITWDVLVPADWDPFKEFKDLNMGAMDDADPRAQQMLKRMREVWDNAPVNRSLIGQAVRIPGFIVPLEDTKDGIKEFLLVPYFGACVHSPPPPSNQIIHVLPKSAVKGFRSMDAVWISGTLANTQTDSYMGASSWRVEAVNVAPYTQAPAR